MHRKQSVTGRLEEEGDYLELGENEISTKPFVCEFYHCRYVLCMCVYIYNTVVDINGRIFYA